MPPYSYPTVEQFTAALRNTAHSDLVEQHIFNNELPFAFRGKTGGFTWFRNHLSRELGVTPDNISVIGSARIGFSLDPYKYGASFGMQSDIDVVIVSADLFDSAWLDLVSISRRTGRFGRSIQLSIHEHRTNHIFWGYVEPGKLQTSVQCYRVWFPAFSRFAEYEFLSRRAISGRLYRTWEHAKQYQLYTFSTIVRVAS